jgi:hypothetical protein
VFHLFFVDFVPDSCHEYPRYHPLHQQKTSGRFTGRPGTTAFGRREDVQMNPLLVLWFLVFGSAVILSVIFYLAENHADIFGNFWVLLGILIGGYVLFSLTGWMIKRLRKPPPTPEKK